VTIFDHAYSQINEAHDYSDANRNIKPVLIEREQVAKRLNPRFGENIV